MRREFTQTSKKAMMKRAGGQCEASGSMFGLDEGQRCGIPLADGVWFEHINPDYNSKDNSIENGAAICKLHWRYKTDTYDRPLIDKTRRMAAKDCGLKRAKGTWGAGRNTPYKQKIGTREIVRRT